MAIEIIILALLFLSCSSAASFDATETPGGKTRNEIEIRQPSNSSEEERSSRRACWTPSAGRLASALGKGSCE